MNKTNENLSHCSDNNGRCCAGWRTTIKPAEFGIFFWHRLYGTSGVVLLIASKRFSTEGVVIGAHGGFGFEFFFSKERGGSYYLEFGGIGTAAVANALADSPIYANGFVSRVGVRYYLE
ncbi:MAG: hypothetical protein ACLFP4_13625 [Spirochaetales bacterium]